MAQNYTINPYETTNALLSDMQKYEDNFECLRTLFAGASEPTIDKVAGMPWYDITERILKIRNNANDDWLGVMHGNTDMKIWIFKNSADLGWTIDDSVEDVVLAFKGRSEGYDSTTDIAYDTTGGVIAGVWQTPDDLEGGLTLAQIPAHTHGSGGAHTHPQVVVGGNWSYGAAYAIDPDLWRYFYVGVYGYTNYAGVHTHDSVGSGQPHNHENTYRPYAAVGTLQYLNI